MEEIPITGFDYVEFYVGNAKQASYFYEHGLGFEVTGYRGLETGERKLTSYALQQNNVKIILTSSVDPNHEVAEHVRRHGDGVRSIGFTVNDAKVCYEMAVQRGGTPVYEPTTESDKFGVLVSAAVQTYGSTIHTFVERKKYGAPIRPGYEQANSWSGGVGFNNIDHIVGNVQSEKMLEWVSFYENVFGFHVFQGFNASDISTQYSALTSRVMANRAGTIKMPINEPAPGEKKSQIQEYLDFYGAAGVQHIAVTTPDIVATVSELRRRGVAFLTVPRAYYENLQDRVGIIDENIDCLAELGTLVDRESSGYLLQIFTKPIEDRPTLFFEIIQRKNGASGFGRENFMALFESLEREQDQRGNL
ncbi:MAG: 4-hydroxyphenylpyruvate dioxygenase [Cyanobacteria bacterium]|nr:4-hydroxyphenylpyruvate dioxygenase [Cyanobacteriota bacterium]